MSLPALFGDADSWFGCYVKGADYREARGGFIAVHVPTFNLPAFRVWKGYEQHCPSFPAGFLICKGAGICVKGCFARGGNFNRIRVRVQPKLHKCLEFTLSKAFVPTIVAHLRGRAHYCRVHSSGDFYNPTYLRKWYEIADRLPYLQFWGYTKCISMAIDNEKLRPGNFNLVYSEGGKEDSRLQEDDRVARVFPRGTTREQVEAAGWTWCMDDDCYPICEAKTARVGLVDHGQGVEAPFSSMTHITGGYR